jgi:putative membrane protein
MSSVRPITSAMLLLLAATGALHAQVTSSQDTTSPSGAPWPVKRIPGTFPSDTTKTQGTAAVAAADAAYIRQAISGNATEVELGRLAQSRAEEDDVKEFAGRMVTDHEAMGRQWTTLARNSRVAVDARRDPAAEQTVERLEDLSGDAFDRAYMTEAIRHHEQDLVRLQQMATSAPSPEVRRLATAGQTTVREHLSLARQVGSGVGVATVATGDAERDRRDTSVASRRDRDDRDDRNRGADRAFMTRLLNDHLLQVRLGRRAEREAKSDETRRFAGRLAADFAWWQERWTEVASRHEVRTSSTLDRQDAQKVERLERASGQQVDRVYATIVADELESLVAELRDQRQADRSEAVQRVVDNELPVMREHLARARKLQAQASAQAGGNQRN